MLAAGRAAAVARRAAKSGWEGREIVSSVPSGWRRTISSSAGSKVRVVPASSRVSGKLSDGAGGRGAGEMEAVGAVESGGVLFWVRGVGSV